MWKAPKSVQEISKNRGFGPSETARNCQRSLLAQATSSAAQQASQRVPFCPFGSFLFASSLPKQRTRRREHTPRFALTCLPASQSKSCASYVARRMLRVPSPVAAPLPRHGMAWPAFAAHGCGRVAVNSLAGLFLVGSVSLTFISFRSSSTPAHLAPSPDFFATRPRLNEPSRNWNRWSCSAVGPLRRCG